MAKAIKIVKPVRKTRARPTMAFKFQLMTLVTNEYASYHGDSDFAKYATTVMGAPVTPMAIRHYREGLGVPQIKMGQQDLLARIAELEAALAAKGKS